MTYTIKEIYYTLQGEGAHTGRPAVFCRFAGCNLWTGREADRAQAVCSFCDTDFVGTDGPGGGKFETAGALAAAVASRWPCTSRSAEARVAGAERSAAPARDAGASQSLSPSHPRHPNDPPFVVCTGGEPLLQLDAPLVEALHAAGFEIALETNGTCLPPAGIDWICVSPKAGADLLLLHGNELKLVYPQPGAEPERFVDLDFAHFFLQPMDGPDLARNIRLAAQFCLEHPSWRLSLQTHKLIGIP